jgi:hypothetical protein
MQGKEADINTTISTVSKQVYDAVTSATTSGN